MVKIFLLCLLFFSLLSCRKSEDTPPPCNSDKPCACNKSTSSPSTCTNWVGYARANASSGCATDSGTFQETACTTVGKVGRCTTAVGGLTKEKIYYSDASTGSTDCGLVGGVWD